MSNIILSIITAILSAGFFAFIQFLITRKDNRLNEIKDLNYKIDKCIKNQAELKQDTTRLQLLVLMTHFPKDQYRLMDVAQNYFVKQNGDWYMSGIFSQFCDENNIPKPDWFKEG